MTLNLTFQGHSRSNVMMSLVSSYMAIDIDIHILTIDIDRNYMSDSRRLAPIDFRFSPTSYH